MFSTNSLLYITRATVVNRFYKKIFFVKYSAFFLKMTCRLKKCVLQYSEYLLEEAKNMYTKNVNMLQGPIAPGLLRITVPIMVMQVLQSIFNIIDMSVLKMADSSGGYAVGAVGSCSMLITLITVLLTGLASGSNVVIARHIGSGDKERVDRAVGTALVVSVVGGFLLLIIGVLFAEVFLSWTNCPSELMHDATLYFRLYFVSVPVIMIYNFAAAIIRSNGNSKSPMIYLSLGGVVKVLMNIVFVAFFNMGVVGLALATLISFSFSSILAIRKLLIGEGVIKIKKEYLRIYTSELKEIVFIGVPSGLQSAFYSIANVIITATVNKYGPDASTGISIANNFDGILYNITFAPSLAVMAYASQNIGHKNVKRAEKSILAGIMITVAFGVTFGSLSAIFSRQLSSIMTNSAAAIEYSHQKMIIISSTYFICGINEIMCAAMRAMRRPIVSTVTTLIYMCLFRFIWVYVFFPLCPNFTFLFLVWPVGWVLSISTILVFYIPTVRRLRREYRSADAQTAAESAPSYY